MKHLAVFDEYGTGENNPESALYYCKGCGEIIPLSKNETFPPCTNCGDATWMNVAVAGEAGQTYGIGGDSPESGLFLCIKCMKQIIPLAKGDNFPPCASCHASGIVWQMIVHA